MLETAARPDPMARRLKDVVAGPSAKVLEKGLGLVTVGDLLRHYPRRYAKRGELTKLRELALNEHVTILAEVSKRTSRKFKERRGDILEIVVTDGVDDLLITYFNQSWSHKELRPGRLGVFSGKITEFRGHRQLTRPEYELLDEDVDTEAAAEDYAKQLIPIYPAVEKMNSGKIGKCIAAVLPWAYDALDPLPEPLRAEHRLPGLAEALEAVHKPTGWPGITIAQRRLKWDEALPLQVALAQRRRAALALPAVARAARPGGLVERFEAALPFTLTAGQREVCEQIAADLTATHPMHRLLQGEVGSGKTVVALLAMLTVVDAGGQAVLLAPTEVLAQQHHRSILELLGPLGRGGEIDGDPDGTRVALLTGSLGARERRAALQDAESGAAGILIGTHAVIEDAVKFKDLGLVVVDEQHRFGVEQRDALRAKAQDPPHLLVMTATPIPRTVAMTVFGDLETSVLAELPRGRSPIASHVVPALEKPHYLRRAWTRIREEVAAGHQAYVVCPRIGGEEAAEDDVDLDADSRAEAGAGADTDEGGEGEKPGKSGPDKDDASNKRRSGSNAARSREEPEAVQLAMDDAPPPRPPRSVVDTEKELSEGPLKGLRIDVLHGRLDTDTKDRVMKDFAAGKIDVLIATTVIEVGVNVPNATVMAILDAERFGVSQLHQLRGRVGRGSAPGLCLMVTDSPEGTPARKRLDDVASTLDGFELSKLDLEQRREGDVLGASQSGRRSSLRLLTVLSDEELINEARVEAIRIVDHDPRLADEPGLAAAVAALVAADQADYLEKS